MLLLSSADLSKLTFENYIFQKKNTKKTGIQSECQTVWVQLFAKVIRRQQKLPLAMIQAIQEYQP